MLCIPVTAKDAGEVSVKISEAEKQADIIELRLDAMPGFRIDTVISRCRKPVIATYRSVKEGGMGAAGPDAAADILISAAKAGAAFIDVELGMPDELREKIICRKEKSSVIISSHIMDMTPAACDLSKLLDKSIRAGGDIVKIVSMALEHKDNLRVLNVVAEAAGKGINIISFCMGPLGQMSRVFSLHMGAYLTFTSLEEGEESAPGQIPVHEMKRLLNIFPL